MYYPILGTTAFQEFSLLRYLGVCSEVFLEPLGVLIRLSFARFSRRGISPVSEFRALALCCVLLSAAVVPVLRQF